MTDERTHYRVAEFAKARGIGLRTVRRWIAEGKLPVERLGRIVLIPVHAHVSNHVANGHSGASGGTARQLRKQRPKKSERDRHFEAPGGT